MTSSIEIHSGTLERRYAAFGLVIASDIPLPDLYLAPDPAREPDIYIRSGTIPNKSEDGALDFHVVGDCALLSIKEVARYWMANGREIIVDPAPDASRLDVRLYLLGSALGAILHQRGILPLHANVIDVGGKAVAFAGHSGAGKSTLAAWFHDRGYRVISDDVCAVRLNADNQATVEGGLPRLRLWRDALELTGRATQEFDRSYEGAEKYDVPTGISFDSGPIPLAAVYLLDRADETSGGFGIHRLEGVEALDALVANTYRGEFATRMAVTQNHLSACISVARSVPVFRAVRQWGLGSFDQEASALREHAIRVGETEAPVDG